METQLILHFRLQELFNEADEIYLNDSEKNPVQ